MRTGSPQRDFLEADKIGLRGGNLRRHCLSPVGEICLPHHQEISRRANHEFLARRRSDRVLELRSLIDVLRHEGELALAAIFTRSRAEADGADQIIGASASLGSRQE